MTQAKTAEQTTTLFIRGTIVESKENTQLNHMCVGWSLDYHMITGSYPPGPWSSFPWRSGTPPLPTRWLGKRRFAPYYFVALPQAAQNLAPKGNAAPHWPQLLGVNDIPHC